MAQPVFVQVSHWGRDDDGDETGATFLGVEGSDQTVAVDTNFRWRFLIDESNSKAWTAQVFTLYYNLNGAGYLLVDGTTPIQTTTSVEYTNNDDTTSQLTGGSGSFLSDNNGMQSGADAATNTGAINDYFEAEYCLTIDSAQVDDADTIILRVYNNTTAIGTYTDEPTITVDESGGTLYYQAADGAITPSGTIVTIAKKKLAGAASFVGTLIKKGYVSLTGAITSSGIVAGAKRATQVLAGAFTSSGVLVTTAKKKLVGVITPVGTLVKKGLKSLVGTITSAGELATTKLGGLYYQAVAGVFTPSGVLITKAKKGLTGAITSSGSLIKKGFKSLAGAITVAGELVTQKLGGLQYKALAGAFTPSGTIARKINKYLSGIISPIGTVVKKTSKQLAGVIAFSGEAIGSLVISIITAVNAWTLKSRNTDWNLKDDDR